MKLKLSLRRLICSVVCFCFLFTQTGFAQLVPVSLQPLAVSFQLPSLKYLSVNSANPNNYFNFLLDKGTGLMAHGTGQKDLTLNPEPWALNQEARKLVNYFFLGITLPDQAFWVNLKPQESNRITSNELSRTDLGKTLLEQDLKLKKDMSWYLNPQNPVGKIFWEKLYIALGKDKVKKAQITTSNRVWIVPAEAVVLETEDGALLVKSSLKVLLESEYASLGKNKSVNQLASYPVNRSEKNIQQDNRQTGQSDNDLKILTEQLMKEIIIPAITKDVNESEKYAPLRQIYHSLVLAQWFKRKYKTSSTVHRPQSTELQNNLTNNRGPLTVDRGLGLSPYIQAIDKGNLKGLTSQHPWEKQEIWQDYLKSYQNGEYKFIDKTVFNLKRMYFSGGIVFGGASSPIKIEMISSLDELAKRVANTGDSKAEVEAKVKKTLDDTTLAITEGKDISDIKIRLADLGSRAANTEFVSKPALKKARSVSSPINPISDTGLAGVRVLQTPEPRLFSVPDFADDVLIGEIKNINNLLSTANALVRQGRFVEAARDYGWISVVFGILSKTSSFNFRTPEFSARYRELLHMVGIEEHTGEMKGDSWPSRHDEFYKTTLIPFLAKKYADRVKKPLKVGIFGIGEAGAATVFDLVDRLRESSLPNSVQIVGIEMNKEYIKFAEEFKDKVKADGIDNYDDVVTFVNNHGDFRITDLGLRDFDAILVFNILAYYDVIQNEGARCLLEEGLVDDGVLAVVGGTPYEFSTSYDFYNKDDAEMTSPSIGIDGNGPDSSGAVSSPVSKDTQFTEQSGNSFPKDDTGSFAIKKFVSSSSEGKNGKSDSHISSDAKPDSSILLPVNREKFILDVYLIWRHSELFNSIDEITKERIEEPLVNACRIFYTKGIETINTTANRIDLEVNHPRLYGISSIPGNYAIITLLYNNLSSQNKELIEKKRNDGLRIYRVRDLSGVEVANILIPIHYNSRVGEVNDKAIAIANEFYDQSDVNNISSPVKYKFNNNVIEEQRKYTKSRFLEENQTLLDTVGVSFDIFEHIKNILKKSDSVVRVADIGCGYGVMLNQLKTNAILKSVEDIFGSQIEAFGVDLVDWYKEGGIEDEIVRARNSIGEEEWKRGGWGNEFRKMLSPGKFKLLMVDMGSVVFSNKMDMITSFFALQYHDDPLQVIANLFNQLSEGGVMVLQLSIPKSESAMIEFYRVLVKKLLENGVRINLKFSYDSEENAQLIFIAQRKGVERIEFNYFGRKAKSIKVTHQASGKSYSMNAVTYASAGVVVAASSPAEAELYRAANIDEVLKEFDPNNNSQCVRATDSIVKRLDGRDILNKKREIHIPHDGRKIVEVGDATDGHTILEVVYDGRVWVIDTQLLQLTKADRNNLDLRKDFVKQYIYPAEEYYKNVPAYADSICMERITKPKLQKNMDGFDLSGSVASPVIRIDYLNDLDVEYIIWELLDDVLEGRQDEVVLEPINFIPGEILSSNYDFVRRVARANFDVIKSKISQGFTKFFGVNEIGFGMKEAFEEVMDNAYDSIFAYYDDLYLAEKNIKRPQDYKGGIRIIFRKESDFLKIIVLDNGLGIYAPETSDKRIMRDRKPQSTIGGGGLWTRSKEVGLKYIRGDFVLEPYENGAKAIFSIPLSFRSSQQTSTVDGDVRVGEKRISSPVKDGLKSVSSSISQKEWLDEQLNKEQVIGWMSSVLQAKGNNNSGSGVLKVLLENFQKTAPEEKVFLRRWIINAADSLSRKRSSDAAELLENSYAYLVDPAKVWHVPYTNTQRDSKGEVGKNPVIFNVGGSSGIISSPASSIQDLASESVSKGTGGIDLSNIELALKNDKVVSKLNSADLKILRAAQYFKLGWNSLAVLYAHEVMGLLEDRIVDGADLTQKAMLGHLLVQLESKNCLDRQARDFCYILKAQAILAARKQKPPLCTA